ncbi:MAG: succinylglutamate desuccinylase/aspartoacylase family protein [Acidimicrobiia bacterium]|nr:succinylglutamate desuccinylase/aspartoacylase family protein [Acidimicrobiia bacterium]
MSAADFEIAGRRIRAGRRVTFELPVGALPTGSPMAIPIQVVHGRREGPAVWLTGAVHGDEINGVEIVRRILRQLTAPSLAGTIVAAPVVNVFGFVGESRYLPDRRDLNRSFPGSSRGSLASRIARIVMDEIVLRTEVGIDFHTGAFHRYNLPQVRGDLSDTPTRRLARAFGAPAAVDATLRDGSLRQAATEAGRTVLLFEGGQVSRFDPEVVRIGVDGTLRVLGDLGMIDEAPPPASAPVEVGRMRWVRARRGGILRMQVDAGDTVDAGDPIAEIGDVLGGRPSVARSRAAGIVLGVTQSPLVNRGDALANVGEPRS